MHITSHSSYLRDNWKSDSWTVDKGEIEDMGGVIKEQIRGTSEVF